VQERSRIYGLPFPAEKDIVYEALLETNTQKKKIENEREGV